MSLELECWNCGNSLSNIPLPISRHKNCPQCFEVLHCCRMCRLFDTARPRQCDHDRTDPPVIKGSANFCEYFGPAPDRYAREKNSRQDSARSDFDSLFGGDVPNEKKSKEIENPGLNGSNRGSGSKLDDLFDH